LHGYSSSLPVDENQQSNRGDEDDEVRDTYNASHEQRVKPPPNRGPVDKVTSV